MGTSLAVQFPFIYVPVIFSIPKLDCFVTKRKKNGDTKYIGKSISKLQMDIELKQIRVLI
jgi:hypothetical protein